MMRVGILLTHPTQYHSPWFQELAKRPQIDIKVFYCFEPDARQQGLDFDVPFEWDIPLLEGYPSAFLRNVARSPGFHFFGCEQRSIRATIRIRLHCLEQFRLIERPELDLHSRGGTATHRIKDVSGKLAHLGERSPRRPDFGASPKWTLPWDIS